MTCVVCFLPIDEAEQPHAAHEPGCSVDPASEDWTCRCDAIAHVRCCRWCDVNRPTIEAVAS